MPTFSSVLIEHCQQTPHRVTVTIQKSGEPDYDITYAELLERAAEYSAAYLRAGIKSGDVLILILQHGRELIYAYWGAILCGAIPSLMPFLTEKLSPERYRADLTALFEHSQPAGVVTYPEFQQLLRETLEKNKREDVRVFVTDNIPVEGGGESFAGLQRAEEDIALLQHSSGSTGLQKGVALSHRAIFNHLDSYAESIRLTPEDVIISWLPLYHDMGLIACFLMPILRGVRVVLMSPFEWVRAPYRMLQSISKYKGTLTWVPNFSYNFCAQKIRDRDLEDVSLASWRVSVSTSEPVRFESHKIFYERFKSFGLRWETLQTSYGMAENVFAASQNDLDKTPYVENIDRESYVTEKVARPAFDDRPSISMMSCGRPIRGTSFRVVDESGADLPERSVGEFAIKSNCMLTEYYNRPDLTAKAFLSEGWYLTGDYGYLFNGEVFVAGRKKDILIIGGKNVYPQDLESLACEVEGVHPGRTVAFGLFDEQQGTEEVVIVAEMDSDDPARQEIIADEIRKYVTKNSAIAVRRVHVVGPKWILKTTSGKIARSANKEKYIAEFAAGD